MVSEAVYHSSAAAGYGPTTSPRLCCRAARPTLQARATFLEWESTYALTARGSGVLTRSSGASRRCSGGPPDAAPHVNAFRSVLVPPQQVRLEWSVKDPTEVQGLPRRTGV